jgi:hypothetical protein
LGLRCPGIEEGRRSVSEEALGHEMVRFEDAFDIVAVNANGDTHDHVLWSFGDLAIEAE